MIKTALKKHKVDTMKPLDEADRDADPEHADQAAPRIRRHVPQREPSGAGRQGRSRAEDDRVLHAVGAYGCGDDDAAIAAMAETGATIKQMGW